MVHNNAIPFGAPSQFRLHVAVDPQGVAYLAVLTPYNQPSGNLHHMKVPFSELCTLQQGAGPIVANGTKGSCTIHEGSDNAHEMLWVEYRDPENHIDLKETITKEDFNDLVKVLQA